MISERKPGPLALICVVMIVISTLIKSSRQPSDWPIALGLAIAAVVYGIALAYLCAKVVRSNRRAHAIAAGALVFIVMFCVSGLEAKLNPENLDSRELPFFVIVGSYVITLPYWLTPPTPNTTEETSPK